MDKPLRVTLIGPESSGKTVLAERLASQFRTSWSPEYARLYVEARIGGKRSGPGSEPQGFAKSEDLTPRGVTPGAEEAEGRNEDLTPWTDVAEGRNEDLTPAGEGARLTLGDVPPIARGCVAELESARERAGRVVIHDTDLISTVVYSRHYYGFVEPWIEDEARRRVADLYVLLYPEFAWTADGVRDQPAGRDALYSVFREALREFGVEFVEVRGSSQRRFTDAVRAIEARLDSE